MIWEIQTSSDIDAIKSAVEEAYMAGCIAGKISSDCFEEAIRFFEKS